MTADHIEEQVNCAIEAANDLFDKPKRDKAFDENEIREFLRITKACRDLSEEELSIVATYIFQLNIFSQQ
jgi:hypothetical protein